MGFLDEMKKAKNLHKKAEWKQGLSNTVVELNDDHMKLIAPGSTDIIFYKDIMNVEQNLFTVNIKTNVKTFSLISKKKRGGTDKAAELQQQLIEKISENKQ